MEIKIGFSPCPNDTFIFDALINKKIDTGNLTFISFLADVEELNRKAFNTELHVTKLSFHAYAYLTEKYILSNSGAALGENVGPLLLSKNLDIDLTNPNLKVAIPGKYTSANFLLSLAYPHLKNKTEIIFSDIENKLINEEFDIGLVIHESRFTFQDKGLHNLNDLGEWWYKNLQAPIPLGAIAIQRNLPAEVINQINQLIKKSIEFAFNNPTSSKEYVKSNAQEMDDNVIYNHIKLYVNAYTLD
ncbi:MAG: 1,4-dihydroxy-6-naphthoate synthase, partial [Bacteroidia bacterium]|nr:1,4-dihydroxy-6-naphthoate synthase [Bacteroidia bacterium]